MGLRSVVVRPEGRWRGNLKTNVVGTCWLTACI